MRYRGMCFWMVWAVVASLGLPAWAAETGFIQVECAPGVQIFLNGELKGVATEEMGGLILSDVPAGVHQVKTLRTGYQPQEETVQVNAGGVAKISIEPFVPKLEISQRGEEKAAAVELKTGSLLIQSVPIECRLTVRELGLNGSAKNKDEWFASNIPVGTYTLEATALGKTLTHEVVVEENQRAELLLNFVTGQIADRGAERAAAAERARREAEQVAKRILEDFEARTVPGLELKVVPVKPGTFRRGSTRGEDDEKPVHTVRISKPFWLGQHEVTQAQYEEVMGMNPSHFKDASRPVEAVSWNDAVSFCEKLTERERRAGRLPAGYMYRLPTEAEWEYACRAGSTTRYSFGDDDEKLKEYANYEETPEHGDKTTAPVGSFKPNAWGLYDMHGNVWEWCLDWYGEYPSGPVTDPAGASSGSFRVLRGGSWMNTSWFCRSSLRGRYTPTYTYDGLGFRVALAPAVQ